MIIYVNFFLDLQNEEGPLLKKKSSYVGLLI